MTYEGIEAERDRWYWTRMHARQIWSAVILSTRPDDLRILNEFRTDIK